MTSQSIYLSVWLFIYWSIHLNIYLRTADPVADISIDFFKKGHSRPLFLFFVFSMQLIVGTDKIYKWPDSNRGSLVSKATALPTEPKPRSCNFSVWSLSPFQIWRLKFKRTIVRSHGRKAKVLGHNQNVFFTIKNFFLKDWRRHFNVSP